MNDYVIMTDSSCDLPQEVCDELGIEVLPLSICLDGKSYRNYLDWREIAPEVFYNALRDGKTSTTAAANIDDFQKAFLRCFEAGKSVLYIGLSSAFSSNFSSAITAIALMGDRAKEFPDLRICAVDSRSASLALGLIVYEAAVMKKEGKSMEEVRDYAESIKLRACHWIMVSDLHFFKRGGRLSGTGAFVGSVLNIKPIVRVTTKSTLDVCAKVRGRKHAMSALIDKLQYADDIENHVLFLGHTDCLSYAYDLREMVLKKYKPKDIIISNVGPVIGSHSGPDDLALFFLGDRDAT